MFGRVLRAPTASRGGGFLTVLGTPGLRQAEIYTLPVTRRTPQGVVDLSLKLGQGTLDCAQVVNVVSVENNMGFTANQRGLALDLPACDSGLDEISFSTVFRDITIAQR